MLTRKVANGKAEHAFAFTFRLARLKTAAIEIVATLAAALLLVCRICIVLKLTCTKDDGGNTQEHHRQHQFGSHAAEGGPIRRWPARSPMRQWADARAGVGYRGLCRAERGRSGCYNRLSAHGSTAAM